MKIIREAELEELKEAALAGAATLAILVVAELLFPVKPDPANPKK